MIVFPGQKNVRKTGRQRVSTVIRDDFQGKVFDEMNQVALQEKYVYNTGRRSPLLMTALTSKQILLGAYSRIDCRTVDVFKACHAHPIEWLVLPTALIHPLGSLVPSHLNIR